MTLPLLERVLYALDVLIGSRPPPRRTTVRDVLVAGTGNPLSTDAGAAERQEAALRMMDADCHGFVLLTVHDQPDGIAVMRVGSFVQEAWWPAVATTLERVVSVAREA